MSEQQNQNDDINHVMDLVRELSQPSLMTGREQVQFLEGVVNACEAKLTTLREALRAG